MFSKKQRLKTSEYDEVFNFGKTFKNKGFLIKYRENKLGYSRFAITIPKKQAKLAVKRHLYKRKFFNFLKETNLINTSKDFVFIFNKEMFVVDKKEFILIINGLDLK